MNMQELIKEVQRLYNSGLYKEALEYLKANGEETPSNADCCLLGMMALQKLYQPEKALARGKAWLIREPNSVYILRLSGVLLHSLGKHSKAVDYLKRANKILPDQNTLQKIDEIKNKQRHIFTDWSDSLACFLFCSQMSLIIIFFIMPYWRGIVHHPTLKWLEYAKSEIYIIKLSTHTLLVIGLFFVTVIAGVLIQIQTSRPKVNETVVFDDTRRIWSYHWHWLLFLLTLSGSLYINDTNFDFEYKEYLAGALGLIAIVLGIYCFIWLTIPGARTRVQLIHNENNKGNRLIVTSGVIMQSRKTYLPQMIKEANISRVPLWIFTFMGTVDVQLSGGGTLYLISPSSFQKTKNLPDKINRSVNDAKNINVFGDQNTTHDNHH